MLLGDSAYPLTSYPTAWGGQPVVGWGFYIGGDTPHIWSDEEIAALPYRFWLPIYTRSDPAGRNGLEDAQGPIAWLRAHHAPSGSLIQLDYETAVNSRYELDFDAAMRAAGYRMELYGSAATVVSNAVPSGGYDEAAWTGSDYTPASTADQFVDVGSFDLNDFRPTAPLWDTRPAPAPQPVPAPQEETDMIIIRVKGEAPVYGLSGGRFWHIVDEQSLQSYINAGIKQVTVSPAELAAIQAA